MQAGLLELLRVAKEPGVADGDGIDDLLHLGIDGGPERRDVGVGGSDPGGGGPATQEPGEDIVAPTPAAVEPGPADQRVTKPTNSVECRHALTRSISAGPIARTSRTSLAAPALTAALGMP